MEILRFVAGAKADEIKRQRLQHKAYAKQLLSRSQKAMSEFKFGYEIGGVRCSPEFVERIGEIEVEAEVVRFDVRTLEFEHNASSNIMLMFELLRSNT
ncbi:hypothetical protein C2S53_003114 [Perilla frutescens var. hirtella]|uniref:Uncharacterized protein n=1 Tax=Perilla frutescens var. hirtella TaxID=608512 RepID=A0AAD4PFS5_PERFH|nr:hypothetical protein C2S53_003114 [Perilla frutescens var. hirtella]